MNFWDGWPTDRILILFSALAFALISVQVGLFHYRGNFRHRVMWGPVLSAPLLALIALALGLWNFYWLRIAFVAFLAVELVAATIGFILHVAGGYTIHAHGSRPVAFGRAIANQYMLWGQALQDLLRDYNFYARLTLVGEVLPNPGNQVALDPNIKDSYGLPVPRVTFSYGDNDLKLIAHGVEKCKEILAAAGGEPRYVVADTAHLHGTCRMGNDPKTSVVNEFCQSHDIANLFICDASVFVTSGGANPTLTVMAIAARTADYITDAMNRREI